MKDNIVLLSKGIYSSRVLFDEENIFFNLSDVIRFLKIKKPQIISLEYSKMIKSNKYIDKHLLRSYVQQYGNSSSENFMEWVENDILKDDGSMYKTSSVVECVEKEPEKETKKNTPTQKPTKKVAKYPLKKPSIKHMYLSTRKDNNVRSRIIKIIYDSGFEVRDFCYLIEFPFVQIKRYLYDNKDVPYSLNIVVCILAAIPGIDANWLIMGKKNSMDDSIYKPLLDDKIKKLKEFLNKNF